MLGNFLNRFKITGARKGKPGFNDVNTKSCQLTGDR